MKNSVVLLFDFAKNYRGRYLASMLLAIAGVISGMLPYFAASRIILLLLEGQMGDWQLYLRWCIAAAMGLCLKVVFMSFSTTFSHEATFAVIGEVRTRLVSKLNRVPMGYLLENPSGLLKNTIVEKADNLETPLAHIVPEMTANLLVPLGIIGYICTLDWRMALVSLSTMPLGFLAYGMMMKDYQAKFGEVTAAGRQMNAAMVEYINGIEVIKAFNQSQTSYAKFADSIRHNVQVVFDWMKGTQVYSAAALGIWPAVLLGVLPVGCLLCAADTLTGADFITIIILSLGITGPILAAMAYTDDIARISTIVGEIGKVLEVPELLRPDAEAKTDGLDIELENVTFSYGEEPVLTDVSMQIKEGSITALVGPSGSGKSTVVKLIASLWDVLKGRIMLGGVDIRKIPLKQLMQQIVYVSQDNFLFNDTIRNNIRMGKPEATDAEVEQVAKDSGCHDFIIRLEHGYETVVGGAGSHLSGGERQRIAIARAMMKDAGIVIFDEATSCTDPENEAVIQEAVSKLIQGKTLIVVAHRLATVRDADQIVVMEAGRTAGIGTHQQLLRDCTVYRKMWDAYENVKEGGDE